MDPVSSGIKDSESSGLKSCHAKETNPRAPRGRARSPRAGARGRLPRLRVGAHCAFFPKPRSPRSPRHGGKDATFSSPPAAAAPPPAGSASRTPSGCTRRRPTRRQSRPPATRRCSSGGRRSRAAAARSTHRGRAFLISTVCCGDGSRAKMLLEAQNASSTAAHRLDHFEHDKYVCDPWHVGQLDGAIGYKG